MMFVIDQQKLFAWLRVREANPARIFAIDCPAYSAVSRKIEVGQVEKVSEAGSPRMRKVIVIVPF
jgi:hypothetical protein